MKSLIYSFVFFFSFGILSLNAQDSAKIAETKAKIAELEKQKASIDAEIGKFKATLPVPVKPNWTYKGNVAFNIGQNLFSNYAAGGVSNFNFQALLHVEANYEKGPHRWLNSFDGRMGYVKNYDQQRKNGRITKADGSARHPPWQHQSHLSHRAPPRPVRDGRDPLRTPRAHGRPQLRPLGLHVQLHQEPARRAVAR